MFCYVLLSNDLVFYFKTLVKILIKKNLQEYDFNIHPESFLKSMSSSMHKQFPVPLEQQQHVHQSIKNEPINSQESVQSAAACYQQQQEDKDDEQQSYQKEAVSQACCNYLSKPGVQLTGNKHNIDYTNDFIC